MTCNCGTLCGQILAGYFLKTVPQEDTQKQLSQIAQQQGKEGLAQLVDALNVPLEINGKPQIRINPRNERTIFVAHWGPIDNSNHSFLLNSTYNPLAETAMSSHADQLAAAIKNYQATPIIIFTPDAYAPSKCGYKFGKPIVTEEDLQQGMRSLGYEH